MAIQTSTRTRFDELEILADEFSESLRAANRSPLTIKSYRLAINQLSAFLRERGMPTEIRAIRREHVEAFLVDLEARGHRPATRAQRFRSLQQFFKFGVERDEIKQSPMARMRVPKVEAPLVPILRDDEVRRLLRACEGREFDDRRDMAIVRLFLVTGIRRQELTDLRLADLDFGQRVIVIRSGKGDRPRLVRFDSKTRSALMRYVNERSRHLRAEHPALWLGRSGPMTADGIAQLVQRRGEAAGLRGLHPHQLRHNRAHEYLKAGMSEGDVMLLMGWRSRAMLGRYGASAATDRALEAFDRFEKGW